MAVGGLVIAGSAGAAPAIAVIGIGIIAVVGISFGLEWLDRKYEITDRAKGYINELGY